MVKRLFDIVCAAVALVVTAPLIGLAAIGIKLSDHGPVFCRARHVGYLGREFTMFKLRTMRYDGEGSRGAGGAEGPVITGHGDERITTIGKFLRRSKIDELPQLFNVLRGDMPIVGPRPEDRAIVLEHYSTGDLETLGVRPGLASPGSIYQFTSGDKLLTGNDPEARYVDKLLKTKLALDGATRVAKTSPYMKPFGIRGPTPAELQDWDAIVRRFPNVRVPHTRAWIDALAASNCGKPLYLLLEDDQGIAGVCPGLLVTALRWKLFGSPLEGWQTVSLGPAFDPERFDTAAFAAALVPYLEREHDVDHIELLNLALDPEAMRAAGFIEEAAPTMCARLFPGDETRTFKQLKVSARRNVKRGQRLGLITKFEDDESFVDEHYAQVQEVYRRGGFAVPFSKHRVLEVFRRLKAAGNLLAISVYLPGGRVNIATGLFFREGRELQLWMWAHRQHYRWYRPTELMTWTVMQRAIQLGCDHVDFMGRGDFKAKFGAELDLSKRRWLRGRHPWLMTARNAAKRVYGWQQGVRGQLARVTRASTAFVGRGGRRAHPARPPAGVLRDVG